MLQFHNIAVLSGAELLAQHPSPTLGDWLACIFFVQVFLSLKSVISLHCWKEWYAVRSYAACLEIQCSRCNLLTVVYSLLCFFSFDRYAVVT